MPIIGVKKVISKTGYKVVYDDKVIGTLASWFGRNIPTKCNVHKGCSKLMKAVLLDKAPPDNELVDMLLSALNPDGSTRLSMEDHVRAYDSLIGLYK